MTRATGWRAAVTVVFAAALVRFVLANRKDFGFLEEADWRVVVPVALLSAGTFVLSAVRFGMVFREAGRPLTQVEALHLIVAARFFNKLVPQSGVAFKAHSLNRRHNLGYGEFASTFGAFVWVDVLITSAIACALTALFQPGLRVSGRLVLPWFVLLLVVEVAVTVVGRRPTPEWDANAPAGPVRRLVDAVTERINSAMDLVNNRRLLGGSLAVIIAGIAVAVLRMHLLFTMVGVDLGLVPLVLFVTVNRLSNVLVVTPGNFGIVEGAFGALAASLEVGGAEGVAVALVLRVVVLATLAVMTVGLLPVRCRDAVR